MARQTGPVYYTGTIAHITYYKLFGEHYYLRTKSSLDAARFYKDPAFAGSRQRSKDFGGAAGLASAIYKRLPKKNRGKGFMGKFIGQVHRLLLQGKTAAEVQEEVLQEQGVQLLDNSEPIDKEQEKLTVSKTTVPVKAPLYTQVRVATDNLAAFIHSLLDRKPMVTALRI